MDFIVVDIFGLSLGLSVTRIYYPFSLLMDLVGYFWLGSSVG